MISAEENIKTSGQFFSTSLNPINLKATNLSREWKLWYTQFKLFMRASNLESQPDQRKVALLLHHLGGNSLDIFNSFNEDVDVITYNELVIKLENYFTPKVNIAMERHNFFTCKQQNGQTIDEYVTVLKNQSLNCSFGNLREHLVRDIFTCGLLPQFGNIREKLLAEGGISLDKAVEVAKNMILAKENSNKLHQMLEVDTMVNAINKSGYKTTTYKQSTTICKKCGQKHKNKCPAEGAKCFKCGKINHFAKMCFSTYKMVKHVFVDDGVGGFGSVGDFGGVGGFAGVGGCAGGGEEREGENFFVGALTSAGSVEWNIEVKNENTLFKCQVDTGAQVNIISKNTAKLLNVKDLCKENKVNILTFSGEKLNVLGSINLRIIYEKQMYNLKFFVIDLNCKNIIGLEAAINLNLIKKVNLISSNDIMKQYADIFTGLGLLQCKCNLKLKENATPIIDPPRKIPFKLYDKLRTELERMVKLKVIESISEPTEWVSSIVLVTKPNGSLRICLDPRNLNKSILRQHYPFPNVEDCKAKLSGAKYFSSLDANSGFWMVPLDDESSKLCTFNTPFGRYRFLRLPFGISAAPEIFHSEMVKLFGDISGLIIYIDDFLIYSSTKEEHMRILENVFRRARQVGLKFNESKCRVLRNEIKFLGHIFNESGVRPDGDKIESIVKMPIPANVKELQRFLGMVNYLGPFIENLSAKNRNLRELLRNDVQWHWFEKHTNEFDNLKKEITKFPVLTYYDPKKELVLSVDASKFALGATIMQDRHPIAYASVSLTESQRNYAQIEKELFAIVFGCIKFHQYIYGSKVIVETDHKPLVTLFDKPLYKIPARLQRFMLTLQRYDLLVNYKPGKCLQIADTLSRSPLPDITLKDLDKEISLHCNFIESNLEIEFTNMNLLSKETRNDIIFQKILEYIKNGWPKAKKEVDKDVMPYFKIKDNIHTLGDILLKDHQILVPKSLRSTILKQIHEGHLGMQRCKNLARQSVYWPGIYSEIDNLVSNCEICMRHQNSNPKTEMLSHDIVGVPWMKLGCDLFEFNKKMYLLVVDYYSKYVEVELLNQGYSSNQVIMRLKSIFSRHGIPGILITDNGPPFNSLEFKDFCNDWEIQHKTSSPYLPRSNGLAERTVQTIKKLLMKAQESGADPYVALLQYRTTPKGNFPSPSELLMSRSLRTKIPSLINNLVPKIVDFEKYKNEMNLHIEKFSKNYNKTAIEVGHFNEGENVMFKKTPTSCWFPGYIVDKCREPRSFIVRDNNGTLYRRNQQHIRKSPSPEAITTENRIESNQLNPELVVDGENYITRKGRIVKKPEKLNL